MYADVIIWDTNAGWSPSLNSSKGTGGFEVYMVQIASWLAKQHYSVVAFQHGEGVEDGVVYLDSRFPSSEQWVCRCLIICRSSPLPTNVLAERTIAVQANDPRADPGRWTHLKSVPMVCVSQWQAGLFLDLGHEVVAVIPAAIDDDVYDAPPPAKHRGRFVCLSAWNKGTPETLEAWSRLREKLPGCQLLIGSPYSHPDDAEDRCRAAGARWIGTLTPLAVRCELAVAEAVWRVCVAPETFGVTDALAEALGCKVYMRCCNGLGASGEVLGSQGVVESEEYFFARTIDGIGCKHRPPGHDRYRVSRIMPQWLSVLFGDA